MDVEKLAQSTYNKHGERVVVVDKKATTPEERSMGNGFILRSTSTSCLIMTCHHIIEGFDASKHTLCIRFAGDATEYRAKILHEHAYADLAVIIVRGTKRMYPALHFVNAEDLPAETKVCLLGYIFTDQTAPSFDPGVPPGITCAPPEDCDSGLKDVVYTSASKIGSSGSPVMLGDKVIGVDYCETLQVAHARCSETINSTLQFWLQIAPEANLSTEEMIDLLQI